MVPRQRKRNAKILTFYTIFIIRSLKKWNSPLTPFPFFKTKKQIYKIRIKAYQNEIYGKIFFELLRFATTPLHSRFVPRSGHITASMRFTRCTSLSHILLVPRKTSHRSKRYIIYYKNKPKFQKFRFILIFLIWLLGILYIIIFYNFRCVR